MKKIVQRFTQMRKKKLNRSFNTVKDMNKGMREIQKAHFKTDNKQICLPGTGVSVGNS